MDEFFVKDGEEEKGPFTFEELTDGRLEPDDLVRTNFGKWEKASDILDFAEYFQYEGYYFPTEVNLATFWQRLLAFIIDYLLMVIIVVVGCYNFDQYLPFRMANLDIDNMRQREVLQVIFSAVFFIYHFLFYISPLKGTLGQYLFKIIVVDADGKPISLGKAVIRSVCKVLSFNIFFLGFISVIFSKYRQSFHDALAKTYVVSKDAGLVAEEEDSSTY
jgi:uncharacterized RDD family membrane protein YckC